MKKDKDKPQELSPNLNDFAYVIYDKLLPELCQKAAPEDWAYKNPEPNIRNPEYAILHNYLKYTFKRLAGLYNASTESEKSKWIAIECDKACINTGLFTTDFDAIYLYFILNENPKKQKWFCVGAFDESDREIAIFRNLPKRARYISALEDLAYDIDLELRPNIEHILRDEENKSRIPLSLRESSTLINVFRGAIDIAKKRVAANYKIAVPHFYRDKVQLLIPIALKDTKTTDLVLVVEKIGNCYRGNTCLTLDMAYGNARLIAKPEVDWLAR